MDYFGTADEISFLENIGTFRGENVGRKEKWELLEGYLIGSKRRVNWGGISKEKALECAKKELERCL